MMANIANESLEEFREDHQRRAREIRDSWSVDEARRRYIIAHTLRVPDFDDRVYIQTSDRLFNGLIEFYTGG